jgi:phospholipid N-methyltransferase
MASLRESMSFLGEFLAQPTQVGALSPSSRFLARALTRPLAAKRQPVNVLEVGAGTGAVTRYIAPYIGPQDRLDICEASPRLAEHLHHEVLSRSSLAESWRAGRVRLFAKRLQDVDDLLDYDFIISGLPLTAFKLADVQTILELMRARARPSCTLSYFEYMAVRNMLATVRIGESGRCFRELSAYLNTQIENFQIAQHAVWLNFPPALARHLRFDRGNGSPAAH